MTSLTEQLSAAPSPASWHSLQGLAHRWLDFGSRVAALQVAATRTTLARQQQATHDLLTTQATPLPALVTDLAQQQWCALAAYGRAWFDIVTTTAPLPGAPAALAAPGQLEAPPAALLQIVSATPTQDEIADQGSAPAALEAAPLALAPALQEAPQVQEESPIPAEAPVPDMAPVSAALASAPAAATTPTSGKGGARRRK